MNEISNQRVSEDEIDLIELLKKVYLEKKFILKTSILAALFGVIYALFQPNEFTSSTTFIPQLSSGVKTGGSSLSGLASLAGINIGSMESSSEFPPSLYPQVLSSIPFKLDLLSSELVHEGNTIKVEQYLSKSSSSSFNLVGFVKKYTIGLPSLILGSFRSKKNQSLFSDISNSKIYTISEKQQVLFNKLGTRLSLSINKKEGFITISFTNSNKNIAAQITQIAQTLLQKKIIEFKNQSSKEMLDFATKQYEEKKTSYEKLQDERAIFVDKNINISSSLFQNKLSRIESEVNISASIVQQLASQVEQAKLQVNKDTPVFTTIQPVSVPFERSAPKRSKMVLIYALSGLILSIGYILIKDPFKNIVKSLNS
jgi:capsular polysaccharide biosynthesis protein